MKDNDAAKLSEANGAISADGLTQPLYSIDAKLFLWGDSSCFGSVIDRYVNNERWFYRIMGSDTKPRSVAENCLAEK